MIDCKKVLNYMHEKARMVKKITLKNGQYVCSIKCEDCPLSNLRNGSPEQLPCSDFEMRYPDQAIFIVQCWSNANPQETFLSKFLSVYPDAKLGEDGTPLNICPYGLGLNNIETCEPGKHHCVECWNQIID